MGKGFRKRDLTVNSATWRNNSRHPAVFRSGRLTEAKVIMPIEGGSVNSDQGLVEGL